MNAPVEPKKLIKGATGDWEVVIGMEIHAQVTSQLEAVLRRLDRRSAASRTAMSPWSTRPCRACCR